MWHLIAFSLTCLPNRCRDAGNKLLHSARTLAILKSLAVDTIQLQIWNSNQKGPGWPFLCLLKIWWSDGWTRHAEPWQKRFQRRHRFSIKATTRKEHIMPIYAKTEAAEVKNWVKTVHNADQTSMPYDRIRVIKKLIRNKDTTHSWIGVNAWRRQIHTS